MRIANNIMAMNTHRAYTQNNDRVQTSAEKLSSGYRINRAGDDAAGLAISEKMRSQIRGLNMSTKNSQDAVSLIQTAEGALQEVHSMLQRMNELAVQSATGTNEGFDRTQIAKEFEQLKREINDISEQTTFNNMNILDGSLSAKGLQRTEYTSGVYKTFEAQDPTTAAGPLKNVQFTEGNAFKLGQKAEFEIDFADVTIPDATNGGNITVTIGTGATKATLTTNTTAQTTKNLDATGVRDALFANDADGKVTFTLDGKSVEFEMTKTGTTGIKFTATSESDISVDKLKEITYSVADAQTTHATGKDTTGIGTAKAIKEGTALGGIANTNATVATASFEFDFASAQSGDVFTIGDQMFVFHDSVNDSDETKAKVKDIMDKHDAITNNTKAVKVDLQSNLTATQLANTIYGAQANVDDAKKIGVNVSGKTITVTYMGNKGTVATTNAYDDANPGNVATQGAVNAEIKMTGLGAGADEVSSNFGTRGNKYVAIDSKPVDKSGEGSTTFEVDLLKMKAGDMLKWKGAADTVARTYTYQEGDKMSDVLGRLGIKEASDGSLKIDGNSWTVTSKADRSADLSFQAVTDYKAGTYDTMKIQVGALEGEQLAIKIGAMNTAGLGLDEQKIYTQESAGKAVTATRDAINKVSDQRALLGAMQNRMTHKIANLKVSVENLQASESRIRDIDIASEMTTFTKNNILSQAATSMLAQANSAPQNVLSLLR